MEPRVSIVHHPSFLEVKGERCDVAIIYFCFFITNPINTLILIGCVHPWTKTENGLPIHGCAGHGVQSVRLLVYWRDAPQHSKKIDHLFVRLSQDVTQWKRKSHVVISVACWVYQLLIPVNNTYDLYTTFLGSLGSSSNWVYLCQSTSNENQRTWWSILINISTMAAMAQEVEQVGKRCVGRQIKSRLFLSTCRRVLEQDSADVKPLYKSTTYHLTM